MKIQDKFLTKYEKTEVRKKHVKSIKMDNHSVKSKFRSTKKESVKNTNLV